MAKMLQAFGPRIQISVTKLGTIIKASKITVVSSFTAITRKMNKTMRDLFPG